MLLKIWPSEASKRQNILLTSNYHQRDPSVRSPLHSSLHSSTRVHTFRSLLRTLSVRSMSLKRSAKGKERAITPPSDRDRDSSPLSPVPDLTPPAPKKSRRSIETHVCPMCGDVVPSRLLATHIELEQQRVFELMSAIGDGQVPIEGEGPGTTRRSAARARQTWKTERPDDTLRSIQILKRRRKRRRQTFKELARDSDDEGHGAGEPCERTTCPICLHIVQGDEDVVEAHVNACIAHEEATRERQEEGSLTPDYDGEQIGNVSGAPGTGFHIRNRELEDVDVDVDVDGDDETLFGAPQFNEGDILGTAGPNPEVEVIDIEGETGESSMALRELVAEGKVVRQVATEGVVAVKTSTQILVDLGGMHKLDQALELARLSQDTDALISALEAKINHLQTPELSSSALLLCRICLDPYSEPTVSTGCWHTCCKECWLRCLGSTKLCPICKRITAAGELRRIYL